MAISSSYSNAVAAEVRVTLARQRRSQEWLAGEAGIPLSTLNYKIRGAGRFTVDEVAAIGRSLGVDMHVLCPPLSDGEDAA